MGELPVPDGGGADGVLVPFLELARKRIESEPDNRMFARISKDPSSDGFYNESLKPVKDRRRINLFAVRDELFKAGLFTAGYGSLALVASPVLGLSQEAGLLTDAQFAGGAVSLFLPIFGLWAWVSRVARKEKKLRPDAVWLLAGPPSARRKADLRVGFLHGGDEATLAQHSAIALWELQAGELSQAWHSEGLSVWRSRVDLRTEARETIRAAGALQDLRLALGDFPAYAAEEDRAKWRADCAFYQAGLSSLRDRVEQQVALQMAVAAIGLQLEVPPSKRAELVDRIAGLMPANELAVENLSQTNTQSADMLTLLNLRAPPLGAVGDEQSTSPTAHVDRQGPHAQVDGTPREL